MSQLAPRASEGVVMQVDFFVANTGSTVSDGPPTMIWTALGSVSFFGVRVQPFSDWPYDIRPRSIAFTALHVIQPGETVQFTVEFAGEPDSSRNLVDVVLTTQSETLSSTIRSYP